MTDADVLCRTCWPHRSIRQAAVVLQQAERLAQQKRGLGMVAVVDGEACAFGLLALYPRVAEISDLIVSPVLRGRGIGTALITFLTHEARRLGATRLEIGVAQSNPRARALYQRLGFVEARAVQIDLGEGPETVWYLAKSLEAFASHQPLVLPP
jgi:ribosomal protein S18 acetylase RimI-like enzyme